VQVNIKRLTITRRKEHENKEEEKEGDEAENRSVVA